MKYKLFLKCIRCNNQSKTKEYNVTPDKMKYIIKIVNHALKKFPRCWICPQCGGILTIQPMLVTIK